MDISISDEVDLEFLCTHIHQVDQDRRSYYEKCIEECAKGLREIYGAYEEDQPVGAVMLNWHPRYSLFQKLSIPEIQDLYVLPEYRRKGVGRRLIEYCEEICKGKEIQEIGISVGLSRGFGAAQRLYSSLGYQPDGMGITHDRGPIDEKRPYFIDADLCLMMTKDLHQ